MKILKRILCLTLVVLMLLPMLVACKGDKDGDGAQSGVDSAQLAATMPDDGIGFQDYGGKTIRFLSWSEASPNEFEVAAEDTKTTLKSAIYSRNEAVKGRLNIDMQWNYTSGCAGFEPDYAREASRLVSTNGVDLLMPYSRVGNMLMIEGVARDLKSVSTIRLQDPWWSQGLLENCTVNDRIYFASGDMTWVLMGMTIAICYNKNILNQNAGVLDQYGVTSMYELVNTNQWTLDSMIKISTDVASSKIYGITGYIVPMDAFYKGCDLKWMEVAANGNQIISEDQHSGKANTVVEKMTNFFKTSAAAVRLQYDTSLETANKNNDSNPINPEWQSGKSLFVVNSIVSITDYRFTELGFDFGVIPMPMYDTAQASVGYKTTPDFEYSICVLPRQSTEGEMLGAVLTVMSSEGFARTAPAYFSEVLKKQISNSVEDYNMWETIKGSIELDGGRLFDWQIAQCGVWGGFRGALMNKDISMANQWATKGQTMINDAEVMNQRMIALEASFAS